MINKAIQKMIPNMSLLELLAYLEDRFTIEVDGDRVTMRFPQSTRQ